MLRLMNQQMIPICGSWMHVHSRSCHRMHTPMAIQFASQGSGHRQRQTIAVPGVLDRREARRDERLRRSGGGGGNQPSNLCKSKQNRPALPEGTKIISIPVVEVENDPNASPLNNRAEHQDLNQQEWDEE